MNTKGCLFSNIMTMGVSLVLSTAAWGRDVEPKNMAVMDEGAGHGGRLLSRPAAINDSGDVVYLTGASDLFFRPFPGYRDYDDIHLEPGPRGELIQFEVSVFGSSFLGSDAGMPYDVTIGLWTDTLGNPAFGFPDQLIASCTFTDISAGSQFRLVCKPGPGIQIPDALWLAAEFSTDNSGWIIAPFDCPLTGLIGFSEDFWAELDLTSGQLFFFFFVPAGCPSGAPHASFGNARIVTEGSPWACCDPATFDCRNVRETQCDIFSTEILTEGSLCNDLSPPCTESGACCNIATGDCDNTFESVCQGFTEVFTPGASCTSVTCDTPDNVPTVTQWGMIVLSVMLVVGLTIKFGRRRRATA